MTEEEKKIVLGDFYDKLHKAQQANQHQVVVEHTDKSKVILNIWDTFQIKNIVLQLDSSQTHAWQAKLTALIKTKSFDLALDFLKGKESKHIFEHAYTLHRLGKNKEALQALKKAPNQDELRIRHLLA